MASIKKKKTAYYLNKAGEFVIENYNHTKPFASFFPGIAGKYGIPMWVFYVNRGQAISSFGTRGKGHAIMEFFPANKAWQAVTTYGFRTFIKSRAKNKCLLYEPFRDGSINFAYDIENSMRITSYGLSIEESNRTLGLSIGVDYFNIPNDDYAGLVRTVTVKNTGNSSKDLQLLDGIPQLIPYGTSNVVLKQMCRTIEAWMHVQNLENSVPYFKLAVDPTDRPEVVHIKEANFYLSFIEERNKARLIRPIVDPDGVFGPMTDYSFPAAFIYKDKFAYPASQVIDSKTPCAFSLLDIKLKPREEKTFTSVIGMVRNSSLINATSKKILSSGYLAVKKEENRKIIENLEQDIFTQSSSREFDLYAKQTYLDNIMRGGYPEVFEFGKSSVVFYLYSRKHGDPERDYNRFVIQPTYFSQGNGNYRDINQNRRCDIWFNPKIQDENLVYFFNLLQPDGFNPLIVRGARFVIKNESYLRGVLKELIGETQTEKITALLTQPFTPGELILFIEENKLKLLKPREEVIKVLLSHSVKIQEAEHEPDYKGGYWPDHWSYNLDLLDTYLEVYPEKLKELVFDRKVFTFYDPPIFVRPRCEKYQLYNGKPRQLKSIVNDDEKAELLSKRDIQPHVVRTERGQGQIYCTTLINKLLSLVANKVSSLDPFGVGIEMEANKPNWFDALNGLPALFGSSLCETFELKRLVLFLKESFARTGVKTVQVNEETREFLLGLDVLLGEWEKSSSPDKDFLYWDKSYGLKEDYRQKVRFGFTGQESSLDIDTLAPIFERALRKINAGIKKAKTGNKEIYASYFINEVKEYEALKNGYIKPTKFTQKELPLFLEGQMHALRLAQSPEECASLHKATKSSELFDKKLKMYKVTAPLSSLPEEIGRCRIFTPGWLENESIWLHMEYKYLLELLRKGLTEEFYKDFKNALIPFMDPEQYGRSILENSSFLVSSAFPDEKLHGNGYVARLSGSTAEFIQIWLSMNLGNSPFILDKENKLNLRFKPQLAGWLFDKNGCYRFNFLGKIPVTYHNPKRKDTFGAGGAKIKKIVLDKGNEERQINKDTIPSPFAAQVREGKIKSIDVYLE